MAKIFVENTEIRIVTYLENDFISLTDMANARIGESRAADVIKNWLRNRYTLEFLGTWEIIHNPEFKVVEFDHFKSQAGLPGFVLSVSEWIEKTDALGIIVKKGKYGGTFAHKDIAFEFGSAISIPFKLYLIQVLTTINKRIEVLLDKDHQIGHSYFMVVSNMEELKSAF
ncbi:MAG: KilA-N domain-containing protein, partial [Ignavibacteria bacterium]|nr:KilA-N domain-containing protein [Ignavibacteria bacterium]